MPRSSSSAASGATSMLSDWPPSKPTSIRTCSAMCHQLRENAVDRIGMDERDLEAEQPGVRLGVDELGALAPQQVECGADVIDLEGDVVHPGPTRGEEPADARIVRERREELHTALADAHGGRLDALVGHRRPLLKLGAEEAPVGRERLVEVVDGHTKMVDPARVHMPMLSGDVLRTSPAAHRASARRVCPERGHWTSRRPRGAPALRSTPPAKPPAS